MLNVTKRRIDQAISLFSPLGVIHSRPQFGGYSLSAGKVMFALVAEGELYLRATRENEEKMKTLNMQQFIYHKRGIEILLRYFQVGEALWQQPGQLIALAEESIVGMESEKKKLSAEPIRLKDLPNINLSMERLLWQVGIKNSTELRLQGAISAYVKLYMLKRDIGLNMLFALEGAILGYHKAALPDSSRHNLEHWFNSFKQEGWAAKE